MKMVFMIPSAVKDSNSQLMVRKRIILNSVVIVVKD